MPFFHVIRRQAGRLHRAVINNPDTLLTVAVHLFGPKHIDALQHQWPFYADYIVMKKNGTVWVIETKGGEAKGKDKNIDRQIQNEFNAFKAYATEKGLHWGFVRDKDNQLYINNTEFAENMADEHCVPITQEF